MQNVSRSKAGGVSVAGYIRDSTGASRQGMRVLGSYALVYILSGGGYYHDPQRGRLRVLAGDLLLVLPDVPHSYGPAAEGHWDEFYVVFDGGIFDAWREAGLLPKAGPLRALRPISYWRRRLVDAAGTAGDSGPAKGLAAACRLQQFLLDVMTTANADEGDWLSRAKAALDAAAIAPVSDEVSEGVIQSVAEELGVSYESFRKRFAREFGVSPGRYHSAAVIEQACRRLSSDETLAKIAAEFGFCDAFHFSKRFKQHVGVSPEEFRRRMQP